MVKFRLAVSRVKLNSVIRSRLRIDGEGLSLTGRAERVIEAGDPANVLADGLASSVSETRPSEATSQRRIRISTMYAAFG